MRQLAFAAEKDQDEAQMEKCRFFLKQLKPAQRGYAPLPNVKSLICLRRKERQAAPR